MQPRRGLKKKLEALTAIFERLRGEAEQGTPIIVEGKSDAAALRQLGVDGTIICVKASSIPLAEQIEMKVKQKKAVVLTDFDRRGVELAKLVALNLERDRIRSNLVYWKELRSVLRRDLKDIEGLPSYLQKLKAQAGENPGIGLPSSRFSKRSITSTGISSEQTRLA